MQAAILTGRRSKDATTLKEVDDSVDRIVAGMEGTPMVDSKSKSLVAYHEVLPVDSPHAIVTLNSAPSVCTASIKRRPMVGCVVQVSGGLI